MLTTIGKSAWLRRARLVLVAPTAIATLVLAAPAHAQGCFSYLSIESRVGIPGPVGDPTDSGYPGGLALPDENNAYCALVGDEPPYDLRIIHPGSTMVKVVWFNRDGTPSSLTLSGLLTRHDIKMTHIHVPDRTKLNDYWQSAWITLDPTSTGTLTATMNRSLTQTVHTVT